VNAMPENRCYGAPGRFRGHTQHCRPAGLVRGSWARPSPTLKPGSAAAVAELHGLGLTVVMLTGDNATTAATIAAQAGVDRVVADVRPEDKAAHVG
jgi:phosphoserine phosphatase